VTENQKKIWKSEEFLGYINLHLKDGLGIELMTCLAKKSNLIDRFKYVLTRFFDNLAVSSFFLGGASCIINITVCFCRGKLQETQRLQMTDINNNNNNWAATAST